MDPADVARADLRSYALRRCIRFYTGIGLFMLWSVGHALIQVSAHKLTDEWARHLAWTAASLFGILAAVEIASGIVMLQMDKAQTKGPETRLWRFALGPHPSWIAAGLFVAAAVVTLIAGK